MRIVLADVVLLEDSVHMRLQLYVYSGHSSARITSSMLVTKHQTAPSFYLINAL